MCLIVFGYRVVPGYKLILAGNRDEFYERPTRPAAFWDTNPDILAGKDLTAGGTWLGVTRDGTYAALTNYRDMKTYNPDARSRGFIVREFLDSKMLPKKYLDSLGNANQYNSFNLLTGDLNSLYHFSSQTETPKKIKPGVHGISNALMNTPWPKVEYAKTHFRELMDRDALTPENLFKLLENDQTYPDESLPDTGLDAEMEKAVSAAFIKTRDYGTRCSTLLFIDDENRVQFIERTFQPGSAKIDQENEYNFKVRPSGP